MSGDAAVDSIILSQLKEMRTDTRDRNAIIDQRHDIVMKKLRGIETEQARQATAQTTCGDWRDDHTGDHGMTDARPSVWVANSTAWAWHHPKRTAAVLLGLFALAVGPKGWSWIGSHAKWLVGLYLARA